MALPDQNPDTLPKKRGEGEVQVAQLRPLDSYFSDIPDASAPVAKPGQQPIEDYFKDIEAAKTGPTEPSQVVKPPTMKNVDIFKPEEGVDYETGAPMSHRLNLFRASSHAEPNQKSEQELYLENTFGKGNYKRDQGGTWLVRPNWDKNQDRTYNGPREGSPAYHDQKTAPWTAVFPRGAAGTFENMGVALAAGVPAMAGAAAGAVGGAAMTGNPAGAAAGAFVGGGGGHLADEGMKALQGFYNKTPLELAGDTALEGGINAAFQGAGPAWNASKNRLYNTTSQALQRWTGVTPETRRLTQGLERYGVTPPIKSIAPYAKALEYDRRQRNMTTGDPRAAERAAVVDELIGETFDKTGFSPQQRARGVSYVNDVNAGNDPGQTGQLVRDAITARGEWSQHIQDAYIEDAHRALDRATETYKRNIMGPVLSTRKLSEVENAGNLARGLTKTMEDARSEFGREMNVAAKNFHDAAGGAPVVDIAATVPLVEDFLHPTPGPFRSILAKAGDRNAQTADDLAKGLPDDVAPNVAQDDIKAIMEAIANKVLGKEPAAPGMPMPANDNPVMVTIEEAHKLRSSLMEMVRLKGDTAGIGMRRGEIYRIVHAIDAAMDKTALEAGGTVGAGLRDFNQQWAEGVVKFTNDDINHIMRETKAGRAPDPGVIADAIMNRKSLMATKQILDMLSPDMRFAVQQADLQNIIKSATIPVGKFGRPTLDPDALIEAIAERASLNRVLYGRNDPTIKALEDLAVAFKVAKGDISLDAMPAGAGNVVPFGRSPVGMQRGVTNVIASLRAAQAEQQAMRQAVEQDALGSLRSNDPRLVDGGARYILESEARTLRAAEVLGPNSPEWETLRREAKVDLLRRAIVKTPTGLGRTVNARALDEGLSGLTARQQEMLLPGSELADFRLLAQQARMLFPELAEKADAGTSFAVASTLGNLPKANAIRRWTWSQVAGYIADSPQVARMLAGTIRQDPYRGRRLLGYLMQTGVNVGMATANQAGGASAGGSEPSFDEKMRLLESVHKTVPKEQQDNSRYKGPSNHE